MHKNIFCVFLFLIIPIVSFFNSNLTIALLLTLSILSCKDDVLFSVIILTISSYNGLIQFHSLSALRFIVEPVIFFILMIKIITSFCSGYRIKTDKSSFLVVFLFITLTVISIIISSFDKDWFFLGLAIKDYIIPLFSFFYFVIVTTKSRFTHKDITFCLNCLLYGIVVVAIISLVNYITGFSSTYNRFVIPDGLEDEKFAAARSIGNISIVRMQSIFGLSTQGAASCLYAIGLSLVLFGRKILGFSFITSFFFVFSLSIAGFLSGSFTFYFTFLIFMLTWLVTNGRSFSTSRVYLIFPFLILIMLFVFSMEISINNGSEQITIIEYAFNGFILPAIDRVSSLSLDQLTFGIGPFPKLYWAEISNLYLKEHIFRLIYDNWMFGLFYQVGLAGTLFFVIIISHLLFEHKKKLGIYALASCVLFSMFGFAHGAFILDKLFISKSVFLICILITNEKINHNSYNL